jgi:hypothetical protein
MDLATFSVVLQSLLFGCLLVIVLVQHIINKFNFRAKGQIISNSIAIMFTLCMISISIYQVTATESYIHDAENENNAILTTKSNCSVTYLY